MAKSMYTESFAANLKILLEGKSVTKVAKEIGIPHQTIYRYLKCQREVSLEYLVRIADYFDEDIDVLIGRKQF